MFKTNLGNVTNSIFLKIFKLSKICILNYLKKFIISFFQQILLLYEKENAYLAESAQFLQRLIQYEIPALRKQIYKAEMGIQVVKKKGEHILIPFFILFTSIITSLATLSSMF